MFRMADAHDRVARHGGPRPAGLSRRRLLACSGPLVVGGLAASVSGCLRGKAPAPAAPTLPALAARYVDLSLRLARHQPSLVEAWLGPTTDPGPRVPVPVLRASIATLLTDLRQARDAATAASAADPRGDADGGLLRTRYLTAQVTALDAAAARLLGESQAFADEAARVFAGHVLPPRDGAMLEARRQELATLLPGRGTLAERHAAFRRRAAVPAARVDAVFQAAVTWCREATRPHLPLPAGETLTFGAAEAAGWAGLSRPTGPRRSELRVSEAGGADPAHLLQLAAHEGVPGHHAQHVLASAHLVERRGWQERQLLPAFGAHLLLAEGAADAGADLLLPLETRARVCAETLLPMAGLAPALAPTLARVERLVATLDVEVAYIAAEYLDTPLGVEAATTRLRDEALVLDPAGMLAFLERQRTKMLAYPLGRRLVQAALDATPADQRWARLAAIATTCTLDPWPWGIMGAA